jgi:hypothetical protein
MSTVELRTNPERKGECFPWAMRTLLDLSLRYPQSYRDDHFWLVFGEVPGDDGAIQHAWVEVRQDGLTAVFDPVLGKDDVLIDRAAYYALGFTPRVEKVARDVLRLPFDEWDEFNVYATEHRLVMTGQRDVTALTEVAS